MHRAFDKMPVMLSISTACCPFHFEVMALKGGRHPERSVLGEVKDLNFAILRFITTAMNAAVKMRLSLKAKHLFPVERRISLAKNTRSQELGRHCEANYAEAIPILAKKCDCFA